MLWFRYWLARWTLRGGVAADIERILRADACSECAAWRCPDCHYLISIPQDHAPLCRRRSAWL